ncbi:MAG: precorrin-3B C(17)-methyltransferase [Tissierellia bacterium]|nr:precorrin-3B C(17)-methyltransferase [Tissierellia bacterium]
MAKLYVIGIGPGSSLYFTRRMDEALREVTAIVGYTPYLEYIEEYLPGKELVSTGMKGEIERCKEAIALAESGKDTAIVSTGDAGLYGMAGPIYQLAEGKDVDIEVIPGISANFAAASLLGAPIMHDFACLSLSDLLTPMELIEKRARLAAQGDFVITLYNPRSKGRPHHLERVIELIRGEGVPGDRPVGLVKNALREGQEVSIHTLDSLPIEEVDMMSMVIIGNSQTQVVDGHMVTPRGYENK